MEIPQLLEHPIHYILRHENLLELFCLLLHSDLHVLMGRHVCVLSLGSGKLGLWLSSWPGFISVFSSGSFLSSACTSSYLKTLC